MTWKSIGAIVGGLLVVVGTEFIKITDWHQALTPGFVGLLCVQLGGLVTALAGFLFAPAPGGGPPAGRAALLVPLLLALGLGGWACAGKRVALQVDRGVYATLAAVQDGERELHNGQVIGEALHADFNRKLLPLLGLGQRYNRIVRDWPIGTPEPAELAIVGRQIADGVRELLTLWPAAPAAVATVRGYLETLVELLAKYAGPPTAAAWRSGGGELSVWVLERSLGRGASAPDWWTVGLCQEVR